MEYRRKIFNPKIFRNQELTALADDSFKQNFLAKHNEYRKKHRVPDLTLSKDLCASSQSWADHLLSIKGLQYSQIGENVYHSRTSVKHTLKGNEPVESWYNEIKDYDFKKPGHQPNAGHFTQVVWKASTEVGVGVATDGNAVFVVAQYKLAGNITNPGYYEENVLPPTS